ncbi:nitroreductase [Craterilacuibacter sp.]|uniref:nitroreductase n=1 Tax=Craterilacuibacter sp. TaxID=2870909 RepID=UPI003F369D3D
MSAPEHTPMNRAAAFDAIVHGRTSTRAFLAESLPRADIEHALHLACQAPSNCNTQPWQIAIASGDARTRLALAIASDMASGRMAPDLPYDGRYDGVYRERQSGAAEALYGACRIARDDKATRSRQFMRNFDFFGAPHVAFFFLPPGFGTREAADLGMCAQTFMLALTAMGYASCPQTSLSFHPAQVRAEFGITEAWQLMFGISFGRPDPEAAVNQAATTRAPHECIVFAGD